MTRCPQYQPEVDSNATSGTTPARAITRASESTSLLIRTVSSGSPQSVVRKPPHHAGKGGFLVQAMARVTRDSSPGGPRGDNHECYTGRP